MIRAARTCRATLLQSGTRRPVEVRRGLAGCTTPPSAILASRRESTTAEDPDFPRTRSLPLIERPTSTCSETARLRAERRSRMCEEIQSNVEP